MRKDVTYLQPVVVDEDVRGATLPCVRLHRLLERRDRRRAARARASRVSDIRKCKLRGHAQDALEALLVHRHLYRDMRQRVVDARVRARLAGRVELGVAVVLRDGADPARRDLSILSRGTSIASERAGERVRSRDTLTPWSRSARSGCRRTAARRVSVEIAAGCRAEDERRRRARTRDTQKSSGSTAASANRTKLPSCLHSTIRFSARTTRPNTKHDQQSSSPPRTSAKRRLTDAVPDEH